MGKSTDHSAKTRSRGCSNTQWAGNSWSWSKRNWFTTEGNQPCLQAEKMRLTRLSASTNPGSARWSSSERASSRYRSWPACSPDWKLLATDRAVDGRCRSVLCTFFNLRPSAQKALEGHRDVCGLRFATRWLYETSYLSSFALPSSSKPAEHDN